MFGLHNKCFGNCSLDFQKSRALYPKQLQTAAIKSEVIFEHFNARFFFLLSCSTEEGTHHFHYLINPIPKQSLQKWVELWIPYMQDAMQDETPQSRTGDSLLRFVRIQSNGVNVFLEGVWIRNVVVGRRAFWQCDGLQFSTLFRQAGSDRQ